MRGLRSYLAHDQNIECTCDSTILGISRHVEFIVIDIHDISPTTIYTYRLYKLHHFVHFPWTRTINNVKTARRTYHTQAGPVFNTILRVGYMDIAFMRSLFIDYNFANRAFVLASLPIFQVNLNLILSFHDDQ